MLYKLLFVLSIFVLILIPIQGCQKYKKASTGTDAATIQAIFPRITGINTCEWTYELTSPNRGLSVGPSNYRFYGSIVLTDDYFSQIDTEYHWETYTEFTTVQFIKDVSQHTSLYSCNEYEKDMSKPTYVRLLLDKERKTMYFYWESN